MPGTIAPKQGTLNRTINQRKARCERDLPMQLMGLLAPSSKPKANVEPKLAATNLTVMAMTHTTSAAATSVDTNKEEFVRALSISKAKFDRVVRLRGADYTMTTESNTDYTTIALRMASGQTTMLFAGKPWL
jgi:hypothetical protein